eukprot:CAMPEP_0167746150 /NCGR_PEP_ID=MMETSP0110_2-20121227/3551_1 /TAXON_ID=629695 /ORGANISM="Gymnochlora sp., Strain CCMP2014" /LENGTH=146 /DNA_ID=CAMNT_0007630879 /DNA_START=743 /DNA_END=1183 /DNA_ORIENTATION=+
MGQGLYTLAWDDCKKLYANMSASSCDIRNFTTKCGSMNEGPYHVGVLDRTLRNSSEYRLEKCKEENLVKAIMESGDTERLLLNVQVGNSNEPHYVSVFPHEGLRILCDPALKSCMILSLPALMRICRKKSKEALVIHGLHFLRCQA